MCCFFMESEQEPLVDHSQSVEEQGWMDQSAVEQFLYSDSSQSSPMVDLNPVGNDEDQLQYLIHGDLPRAMFEQLDMFEQQNFALESAAAAAAAVASHEEAGLESLDDLIQVAAAVAAEKKEAHLKDNSLLPTKSLSSAASSSSDVVSEYHGAEFCSGFGAAQCLDDSGSTSILRQIQIQQQPRENGSCLQQKLEDQATWVSSDPTNCVAAGGAAAFSSSFPHTTSAIDHKGNLFLDSSSSVISTTNKEPQQQQTETQISGQAAAQALNLVQQQQPGHHGMATMRETLYRMAIWRPITTTDCLAGSKPKRRNVRISSDPQTVAARHRRERISTKIRILQRLVPGGTKMDTASMLDEAIHYVKYLKSQVQAMELLEQSSESLMRNPSPTPAAGAAGTGTAGTGTGTTVGSSSTTTTTTAPPVPAAAGICHLYNQQSGGLLNGSIFWPQQFSMDNSSTGLVLQQVNISGY